MMVLICGQPNAGKTTYSKRFKNVVHFDDYIGRYEDGYRIVESMDDVCVEGLFTKRKTRLALLKAYKGNDKVCYWIDTPIEVCKERADFKGTRHFEPPSYDEGWDEIKVIK